MRNIYNTIEIIYKNNIKLILKLRLIIQLKTMIKPAIENYRNHH